MKDYDHDLIWSYNPNYPNTIHLKLGNKKLSTIFRYEKSQAWRIASEEGMEDFGHLFKDHDGFGKDLEEIPTYNSRIEAMRVVMKRVDKYVQQFNSEGIENKMYYVHVHYNEHMFYATEEYFNYT